MQKINSNEKVFVPKEFGMAGVSLELGDGIISIYHHEGHVLLKSWIANKGDWDKIWNLFDKLEKKADEKE